MAKLKPSIKKLEKEGYEVEQSEVTKTFGSELIAIATRPNSGTIKVFSNKEGEVTGIEVDGKHNVFSVKQALETSQIIGSYGSVSRYKGLMGR